MESIAQAVKEFEEMKKKNAEMETIINELKMRVDTLEKFSKSLEVDNKVQRSTIQELTFKFKKIGEIYLDSDNEINKKRRVNSY
jgi:hypothetical protein